MTRPRPFAILAVLTAMFVLSTGLLVAVSPPSAVAAGTSALSFVSDPGDYIGGGQSSTYAPDTASFNATASTDHGQFHLSVTTTGGEWWYFDLAAPVGQELQPGTYSGAARWPFQSSSQPGLSFSGNGRGCNTLTGQFTVLEAKYGPSTYVERFHATFEQHCEGGDAALRGEVTIVNPPPPAALKLTLTIDPKGVRNRVPGTATVNGTISCTQATTVNLFGTLRQRASRNVVVSGSFNQSVNCSSTPKPWSATVTGDSGRPFNSGSVDVALVANAFDPNYGVFVSQQANATVSLAGK
jgi:hypothetical protein